jgi:2-succinyl-6-hydroxy-2,4-cyclohexadiene-1-carboxylate synthase
MTETAPRPRACPPVVLLHGFTGSAGSWLDIEGGLAHRGCTVVTLDLPGHGTDAGRTDSASFELPAVRDGVATAVDGPLDLVGYSMGGRIALHFAAAFPARVRSLVLESASPGLHSEEERRARVAADRRLGERAVTQGIETFVRTWESAPLFRTQSDLPRAERVVVRGAGHCVHLERPSVWVDHVCSFLERTDPCV